MKKISNPNYINFVILFVVVIFTSCNHESDDPIGKWDDNIKLSEKSLSFDSTVSSGIITTQGEHWWITEVNIDGKKYYHDEFKGSDSAPYSVVKDTLSINRSNLRTLNIAVDENKASTPRVIEIIVQAGNYFDGIIITQLGK